MNKIILIGRLTRDPETRCMKDKKSTTVANFSIAVNRRFKREGEPEADFFNCTAFGKQADFVEKYLKRGIKMVIIGHMQNNNYTNKNGEKVYSVQVIVDEMEFAESKNTNQNENNTPQQQQENNPNDGFMQIPEDSEDTLPFS